jgi:hypothetical protein
VYVVVNYKISEIVKRFQLLPVIHVCQIQLPIQTPRNAVFWDVTPCGSCKNRRFGGTYRLHHRGGKNQRPRINVSSKPRLWPAVGYSGIKPQRILAVRRRKHDSDVTRECSHSSAPGDLCNFTNFLVLPPPPAQYLPQTLLSRLFSPPVINDSASRRSHTVLKICRL